MCVGVCVAPLWLIQCGLSPKPPLSELVLLPSNGHDVVDRHAQQQGQPGTRQHAQGEVEAVIRSHPPVVQMSPKALIWRVQPNLP